MVCRSDFVSCMPRRCESHSPFRPRRPRACPDNGRRCHSRRRPAVLRRACRVRHSRRAAAQVIQHRRLAGCGNLWLRDEQRAQHDEKRNRGLRREQFPFGLSHPLGRLLISHTHADAPVARHSTSTISNSLPVCQWVASPSVPTQSQHMGSLACLPAHMGQSSVT